MSASVWAAVWLSVKVAAWCTVLATPVAVPLGYLLARKRFVGRSALALLLFVPLVLPPVVTGFMLLSVFRPEGLLGALGVPFTFAACVVASFVVSLPLYTLAVRQTFEAVDPKYEEVARTLGESPMRAFWRVTLPLALPGVLAGATLSFARALGEFGATAVLAGNVEGETRTIALAVYTLMETPGGDTDARSLVLASLLVCGAAVLGYEWLRRRHRARLELPG